MSEITEHTLQHTSSPEWYNSIYIPLFHDRNRTNILYGGRDSGKSDFIAQLLILACINLKYFKGVLVRRHYNTIRESQWEAIKSVSEYMGLDHLFTFTRSPLEIRCINGNRFISRGCDDPDKLKSTKDPTHLWIEEADQIKEEDYDTLSLSLRNSMGTPVREYLSFNSGTPTHWLPLRFFPTLDIGGEKKLDTASFEAAGGQHNFIDSPVKGVTILHTSYLDNEFITDEREERYNELSLRNKFKYHVHGLGLFGIDVVGALWTYEMIKTVNEPPELLRVAIGLDPSITSTKKADEAGIIAAGLGVDGLVYVLNDISGVLSPAQWAQRADALAEEILADVIIAEKNQGGDMILEVFKSVGATLKPKLIHASKGKRSRAEPVAALYEEGKVVHVGQHTILENELCTWDASTMSRSPNRLDALVYAVSELAIKKTARRAGGVLRRPRPVRAAVPNIKGL